MTERPSAQRKAGPGAAAFGLAMVAMVPACRATPVVRGLPTPPVVDDPDIDYPPRCAADGMRKCQRACNADDRAACLYVASAFDVPTSSHHDPQRARALMTRACDGGYARACASLGLAIGSAEPRRSAELLSAACERGYGRGCVWYAALHVLGAMPFDWEAAGPWFRRGCAADDALACVAWADLLRTGRGVAADPQAARESHHRACELGRKSACDEEAEAKPDAPRLHAIFTPDPRMDELVATVASRDVDVRVRYCVGPGGEVEVQSVEPERTDLATLYRRVVGRWRFTPTGASDPRCRDVVFGVRLE